MLVRYVFILLCFSNSVLSFGKEEENTHTQKLKGNGIELIDNNTIYSDYQYYLLETHNFLKYRNYTTRRVVQIEDGPKLLLYSLKEMMAAGNTIPPEVIEQKKEEVVTSGLIPVITLINIGFKYLPKKDTETGY